MNKLWILDRSIQEWEYGRANFMIVRASSEMEARKIASENSWQEGPDPWFDEKKVSCEELSQDGESGIISVEGYSD